MPDLNSSINFQPCAYRNEFTETSIIGPVTRGRIRGRRVGLATLFVVALMASACSSEARSAKAPTTTPSSTSYSADLSVQTAAHSATLAYRGSMARAGQQIANDINHLAVDEAANVSITDDLIALQGDFDVVRPQLDSSLSGSLSGPVNGNFMLGKVSFNPQILDQSAAVQSATIASLMTEAPDVEFGLSRIILSPGAIAQMIRQDAEWIAIHAPDTSQSSEASSSISASDLLITAQTLATWLQALKPLGDLLAPAVTAQAQHDVATLSAAVSAHQNISVLDEIQAANAVAADLAQLSGQLEGYGVNGAYQ